MRRAGWLLLLALSACGSASTRAPLKLQATVCGALCDGHDATGRGSGDFTGMVCATQARIRVYAVDGNGDTLSASPVAQKCVDLDGDTRLVDLFQVSEGFTGAVPVSAGRRVSLDDLVPSGRSIAEVALYAPGSVKCPDDGVFVAFGRSAVVDLGTTADPIAVPLGCHATCGSSQPDRSVNVSLRDIGGGARSGSITLGDYFHYESLLSTTNRCAVEADPDSGPGTMSFRPFDNGAFVGTSGTVSYGVDTTKFGGCIAAQVKTGDITTYACLDAPTSAAPTAYLVPESNVAAIAGAMSRANEPVTAGTLVIVVVDKNGIPQSGATLSGTALYPMANWALDVFETETSALGVIVVPNAPYGTYQVFYLGGPENQNVKINLAGGPKGTITTVRLALHALL